MQTRLPIIATNWEITSWNNQWKIRTEHFLPITDTERNDAISNKDKFTLSGTAIVTATSGLCFRIIIPIKLERFKATQRGENEEAIYCLFERTKTIIPLNHGVLLIGNIAFFMLETNAFFLWPNFKINSKEKKLLFSIHY